MWIILGVLFIGVGAQPLFGQAVSPRRTQLGAWTGVAWQNPTVFGAVTQRELLMAVVQVRRRVAELGASHLAWTIEFIPAMFVAESGHPVSIIGCFGNCVSGAATIPGLNGFRRSYGFGIIPIGAEWTWPVLGPLRVTLVGGAGLMRFSKNTPHAEASKFNFIGQAGLGFGIALSRLGEGFGGYRFVHLSNGSTADFNPGLDASVWLVGWRWSV